VKVLFVGEGEHDIGPPVQTGPPRPSRGVVSALCRLICPAIHADSIAMSWRDLSSYDLSNMRLRKRDLLGAMYVRQMKVAALIGPRKFQCVGAICVVDRDGDDEKMTTLQEGRLAAEAIDSTFRFATGVAIESIEAWSLGDPDALAKALGISTSDLDYRVSDVEKMKQSSGKEEFRSKTRLQKLAESANLTDCVELREKIAQETEISRLAANCPKGFAPFMSAVQDAFCPSRADKTN